jgi:hypothetical protein
MRFDVDLHRYTIKLPDRLADGRALEMSVVDTGARDAAQTMVFLHGFGGRALASQHLVIDVEVCLGTGLPTEVLGHAVCAQSLPIFFVAIDRDGPQDSVIQIVGSHAMEHEAAGTTVRQTLDITIHHRIGQAAGVVHQWRCTVTLAVHLVETTGFET